MSALFRVALLAVTVLGSAPMAPVSLKIADTAPDFTLRDQNNHLVRLGDFRAKRAVVLAFYIKAFTSG